MIDDIMTASQKAKEICQKIRQLPPEGRSRETVLPLLREAVARKLMIEEYEESNIEKLVILSIKTADVRMGRLSNRAISNQITKYDCHQTSLVVQKKVLLLIFMEQELGIHMTDEEATSVDTVEDLCRYVLRYLADRETTKPGIYGADRDHSENCGKQEE